MEKAEDSKVREYLDEFLENQTIVSYDEIKSDMLKYLSFIEFKGFTPKYEGFLKSIIYLKKYIYTGEPHPFAVLNLSGIDSLRGLISMFKKREDDNQSSYSLALRSPYEYCHLCLIVGKLSKNDDSDTNGHLFSFFFGDEYSKEVQKR